ncbi:MAG: hypothetical protein QOD41_4150, partial [Cryptosporangiaceae bacterium]|nr:hypothetical protein [Cryptosporangiaceae bacterium]
MSRMKVWVSAALSATLGVAFVGAAPMFAGAAQAAAPVGQGFTLTTADLAFILKQIKIAENHVATTTSATGPCGSLLGPGPNQVPDAITSYGLRTVDGSCNNLEPGRNRFAASNELFPRLTTPVFKGAEPITPALPVGAPGPTSYAQKTGNVVDSQPRVISNLIVDQTSTNPAAVAAAGFPVRAQAGATGVTPCTTEPAGATPGIPAGCVPAHKTLFIQNVTTDVGLSPPYNSLFTFFGQFFDHGVDQTVKGGATVFVPLKADDPLIAGPDHILGNADDLPPQLRFMVLTRAQNQPGPDGILGNADDVQEAANTDTPWVDNSQTYTSHAAHQVFLREYVNNPAGKPVATGNLLGGTPGTNQAGAIGNWAQVKAQAANLLGLKLEDKDVTNVPQILADAYGKFVPGPARGLPQYVTKTGLVEGNLAGGGVPVPANVLYFDTPFLTDIAHNADPSPQDTDNNPGTPPVAPTPDANTTASSDFAHQPAGTYDDELLNAHYICGDGRCNENIALTTIHQVFHSEHNRLVQDVKDVLSNDTSPTGAAALAEWKLASGADGWNGERLFQAARFVNEMEYQHLVFEEFARKMQPAVRPFHVYSPDIQPAISAEFAGAVYRFGHSMLDDDVARTNPSGVPGVTAGPNNVPLLTAFLNPPEFTRASAGDCDAVTGACTGGAAGTLSAEQAAGAVVMGSSDQAGNELDEFVTETLRNNLLGLPLDLPTLNLTRAREMGIPPLNEVRRQINNKTNDAQLAPYTSWADFGQNIKHPESLINFVAAYGKHPTITSETTLAGKRAAARAIVDPAPGDVAPADATDFMNSAGSWASSASGVTTTGLDDVDLWVGGLAEKTNLFGGLLGSTNNYVFQSQLESLQDGDRLYYLARTPGLNLRTQLEGNSFSELIMRNTDGTNSLKADAFGTADCRFQLANLEGTPAGFAAHGATVADDPSTTDCDESLLLLRKPDGTIQYREKNTVDPPGINGQSVYNGTPGADRVVGGNDNDTFWGGAGNDRIEGNGGDDIALGGEGDDIITDSAGADVPKGGPGNDAIDAGIGDDIPMGGPGQDFINGGANDNETFAGPGNDFVIAGQGADAVFGDSGDDWIEGGSGQDLLQGDHGAPFFDDPAQTAPGNDIMIGQVGENDYDAEGGDDVMAQNAAIDRNAGAGGFDWAFHQFNTIPADDDMNINNNLGGVGIQLIVNRDRWQETEADSGGDFNDVIKGTNAVPATVGGGGFQGCDALDAAGVARISGLDQIVTPAMLTVPAATVAAISTPGYCPLTGNVWGDGDIIIGGLGSDTITGRAGNDILDGDRYLRVRISIRTNLADPATEIGTANLMEAPITASANGTPLPANLVGKTLQQAVFDGSVNPGSLVGVKEIITPTAAQAAASPGGNVDTAVFTGPQSNYTVTSNPDGSVTVTDNTGTDGTDTLRNFEKLQFSDTVTTPVGLPGAGAITTVTPASGSAVVTFTAPAVTGGSPITGFTVRAFVGAGTAPVASVTVGAALRTAAISGLVNGTSYTFDVIATNAAGPGPASARSAAVLVSTTPGAPALGTITGGDTSASVNWSAASDGGSPLTGYSVRVFVGAATTPVQTVTVAGNVTTAAITGLVNGTSYTFDVTASNANGAGPASARSA